MPTNLWLLTAYAHAWEGALLFVAAATDVPCHLWLRYTDKEEHIHHRQKDRRGVLFLSVPDFCFVEWQEIEQNEAGDTYEHTFSFNSWAVCQRRWWHLRGQIGGAGSPSTSPIFTEHYPGIQWVLDLGVFLDPTTLIGDVKLEEGNNIHIINNPINNSLRISVVE